MRRVALPNQEWRELGSRRRRQVARHAPHGRRYPDPDGERRLARRILTSRG